MHPTQQKQEKKQHKLLMLAPFAPRGVKGSFVICIATSVVSLKAVGRIYFVTEEESHSTQMLLLGGTEKGTRGAAQLLERNQG